MLVQLFVKIKTAVLFKAEDSLFAVKSKISTKFLIKIPIKYILSIHISAMYFKHIYMYFNDIFFAFSFFQFEI